MHQTNKNWKTMKTELQMKNEIQWKLKYNETWNTMKTEIQRKLKYKWKLKNKWKPNKNKWKLYYENLTMKTEKEWKLETCIHIDIYIIIYLLVLTLYYQSSVTIVHHTVYM